MLCSSPRCRRHTAVTTLDGKTTTHTLDSECHTVRDLKFCVEKEQGVELQAQRFWNAKVSGDYLSDGEPLEDGVALGLYVHKSPRGVCSYLYLCVVPYVLVHVLLC